MAPRRKAKGLDGIPGEMLSAAVPEMGQALYPLVLKSVVKLCQPVQWRGGVLQEAWKQSGSAAEPGNYRSLFISSQLGKCYHRLLRRRVTPYLHTYSRRYTNSIWERRRHRLYFILPCMCRLSCEEPDGWDILCPYYSWTHRLHTIASYASCRLDAWPMMTLWYESFSSLTSPLRTWRTSNPSSAWGA